MSIQPEGENLRKAVKWIGAARLETPDRPLAQLIDQASRTFDLTPMEATSLDRLLSSPSRDKA